MEKKHTVIMILFCVSAYFITIAWGEETPKVVYDFSVFGLKVVGTEKVDEVSNKKHKIHPGTDQQLIVITLEGKASAASNPVFIPAEFAVAFERESTVQGTPIMTRNIRQCVAMALQDSEWTIMSEELHGCVGYIGPKSFSIRLAAIVPKDIRECLVIVPTVLQNKAIVETEQGLSEQTNMLVTIDGRISNVKDVEEYLTKETCLQIYPEDFKGPTKIFFKPDGEGRLVVQSDLAMIPFPKDGKFAFREVAGLKPNVTYTIAVKMLKRPYPGIIPLVLENAELFKFNLPEEGKAAQTSKQTIEFRIDKLIVPLPEDR